MGKLIIVLIALVAVPVVLGYLFGRIGLGTPSAQSAHEGAGARIGTSGLRAVAALSAASVAYAAACAALVGNYADRVAERTQAWCASSSQCAAVEVHTTMNGLTLSLSTKGKVPSEAAVRADLARAGVFANDGTWLPSAFGQPQVDVEIAFSRQVGAR